jgi:hypothetical protein
MNEGYDNCYEQFYRQRLIKHFGCLYPWTLEVKNKQ